MDVRLLYGSFVKSLTPKKAFTLIFAVGFIGYMNTLVNGMFWDDYDSVLNNRYVHDFAYFPNYFSENLTAGAGITDNYWRPLLLVSFAVDYAIGGTEPFFFHFQNLSWHIASGILVFLVGTRLSKNALAGLAAALLFLVHPLQAEAVTYVAGRADPMHTALMFGSIFLFLRHTESKTYQPFIWSLILFILSLLTKERAVVLPFLLTLILFLVVSDEYVREWKRKLILLAPYYGIAGAYAGLRMTVLHFTGTFDLGAATILQHTTHWQKTLVLLSGIGTYGKLIVWPARLYMEKTLPIPQSAFDPTVLLGIALLALSTALIALSLKRKQVIAFCLLACFTTLLPSMHVYPIQGLLYEHWLYPSFPWLFLAIGIGLSKYLDPTRRPARIAPVSVAILVTAVIFAFGVRTFIRNTDWQNPIRFYEKNLSLGGESGRVYTNLGMAYDEAHRHDEAIGAYLNAVRLSDDTLFQPWYDMGNTLAEQKKTDEAIGAYRNAIRLNPHFTPTYTNIAKIYADRKDTAAAKTVLDKALATNPDDLLLLYAVAAMSANAGDLATAQDYAKRMVVLDPNNPQAREILSYIRLRTPQSPGK